MPIHLNSIPRRSFLAGAAACAIAPSAYGDEAESETWALLADTHIDADPAKVARGVEMAFNLETIVVQLVAERETLQGVIIDGDCAFLAGLPGDYELLAKLLKPLSEAGLPVHLTMGNHDDRGPCYQAFAKSPGRVTAVESKHVSVMETPLANWVLLDSLLVVNKVTGEMGEDQLRWLDQFLQEHSGKPVILVGHHNPQFAIREGQRVTGLADTSQFMSVLAKHPHAQAYLYGHTHHWRTTTHESGLHLVNLPPSAYVFDEKRPNGWVRAELSKRGMKLTLCALDANHPEHGITKDLGWRG
ncbi:MAG: metallophosphoesterase [Verrucomicrobiota bacterium]